MEIDAEQSGEVSEQDGFEEPVDIIARTPPQDNASIEVGETLALGFPHELVEDRDASFSWSVNNSEAELLHDGSETESIPSHDGRTTALRVPDLKDTRVKLEVDVDGETYTYQREIVLNPNEYDVMQDHAPVLRFHGDELYHPTRYEALFENSELRRVVDGDEEVVLDDANLYDLSVVDRGSDDDANADYFEFVLPQALTDEWNGWANGYGVGRPVAPDRDSLTHLDPSESDVYPPTVYSNLVEDVYFQPDDSYLDRFPDADPSDLDGGTYTAVGYWMFYVNDPKPSETREADRAASHTGDQEPFYILFDQDTGEPEWVLAQQHMGGEYRKWEHVETVDGRPVIYPAEGAHSNFFGANQSAGETDAQVRGQGEGDRSPEYIYQDQYVDDPGDTSRTLLASLVLNYVDPVGYGEGVTWAHEDAAVSEVDETYEIAVLTNDESWSDEPVNIYTYPQPLEDMDVLDPARDTGATAGNLSTETGPKFDDPGAWASEGEGPEFDDGYRRLFPDVAQIDAEFSDEDDRFTDLRGPQSDPEDRIQESVVRPDIDDGFFCDVKPWTNCVEAPPALVSPNTITEDGEERMWWTMDADDELGVNVINSGMQPHEFVLGMEAGGSSVSYGFYVNSIYPRNVAGAMVPLQDLGLNEAGDHDLTATLNVYQDAYELDREVETLSIVDGLPEPELEIVEDGFVDAGTVDDPRRTSVDVFVKGDSQLDLDDARWSLVVAGVDVDVEADLSDDTSDDLGRTATLRFDAPDVEEAGSYDVYVELKTTDETLTASEPELAVYSEPGEAGGQTATAVVVDTSGSMSATDVGGGTRMSAAKDAAQGVVDRQADSDYLAVVGFSSGSTVRQGLTQMDEGRDSAKSAIASMSAGGGTNMGAGLRDGIDEVQKAPAGVQQNVILMSDGGRNRGPSESAMRDMIRDRMNPNDICLQTNTLGDGADHEFKRSLADTAGCSSNTESHSRDEIIEDFIQLTQQFTASEIIQVLTGFVQPGELFESSFHVDEGTSNVILDVATGGLGDFVDLDAEHPAAMQRQLSREAGAGDSGTSISSQYLSGSDAVNRTVRLYRPNGTLVEPAETDSVEVSTLGDRTVYRITDPEAGEWSYDVQGGDEGNEFEARVTANSLTQLEAYTSSNEYYAGSNATIDAELFGAEAIEGATVTAEIETPDGDQTQATLDETTSGVYRATVPLAENATGRYNATVKAVDEDRNVERRESVSWNADYAAPVTVNQTRVPEIERNSSGVIPVEVESRALLGVRSVSLSPSKVVHEEGNTTLQPTRVSLNRSHLLEAGDTLTVNASVDVPENTSTGNYSGEITAQIDGTGVTVDELEFEVVDSCPVPPENPGTPVGPPTCPPGHGGEPPGQGPPDETPGGGPPGHAPGGPP